MAICTACSNQFEPTNRYRPQLTCSKECRYRLVRARHLAKNRSEDRACEICGTVFRASKKSGVRTCSRKCGGKLRTQKTWFKCVYCGKSAYGGSRRYQRKYCSNACVGKAKAERARLSTRKRLQTECNNCGKKFEHYACRPRKFCSKECHIKKHARKVLKRKCEGCSVTFDWYEKGSGGGHFCSHKCFCDSIRNERETRQCITCEIDFSVYVSSEQKYCSHQCYLSDPYQDTSIELKIVDILERHGIDYMRHYRLWYTEQGSARQCAKAYDFLINGRNILIEADGDYWHANPDMIDHSRLSDVQLQAIMNDAFKNELAQIAGFRLLRFWENEINDDGFEASLIGILDGSL